MKALLFMSAMPEDIEYGTIWQEMPRIIIRIGLGCNFIRINKPQGSEISTSTSLGYDPGNYIDTATSYRPSPITHHLPPPSPAAL